MSRINRLNVAGALITGLLVFLAAPCTQAATLVWTGGVDNVWNTSTTNWLNGGVAASYTDGDDVVFDSSARITTNINIAGTFSPHSIVFSNSNTKTYSFTNGVLTGTGGILKTNNGTVYFGVIGTADTDITYPISSMLFSGGTVIYQGAIRFGVNTNNGSVFDFASGGWPVAFGTGPITLNGSTAEFRCSQRSGLSVATVLTNDFTIGANGGKIDVSKANVSGTGGSPQHNICGNINQYGNLYYATGNGAGGLSNTFSRILTGVTRVYSSCTTTVEGAGTFGWARVAYEQNMTNMIPGAVLTLIGGNQNGMIEVTGDNRGLTGGIILRSHATAPNPVIFTGTNAMGGANLTVATNAYAGLAFDFTPSLLSSMIFEDGAVLGIDSNSSVNINLSAGGLNKDIWLGTSRGATYTGTLTPAGNAYKLCGGGVNANLLPLLLSNTNALTGDCYLFAGNTNSYQPPGMVILAASNSYTLGTIISGSKRADPTVVARSAGSLGTGPILINRISGSASGAGPTLQIEVPYRVLTADLTITGQVGHATLNTVGPLILQNNLTLYGTNSLNIMGNNGINSAIIFNQAASGKAVTMGANSRINQTYGLFDPVSPANLPVTIGYRQDVGGTIVLSTNFTWANLVSGRTWRNISTPVGGEWNGRSFAARGAAQVIDGTGAFESGTTNTWLGISPILMGSTVTNADGTYYANAGVKIARDIIISGDFSVTVASTGPGITNPSTAGFVYELASSISGTGSFRTVAAGTGHPGQLPELVLSGTSVWSGVHNFDYQNGGHYMVGPGGMAIGGSYQLVGFVRFNGNASIPSGNSGSNCYVLAMGRSSSEGKFGYLLTGSDANPVYTLTNGVRFMLGGGSAGATLGLAIGQATLRDSMVSINNETGVANTNQDLYLFVRDTNSTFTLGTPGQAVRFSSCALTLNAISQGWYSPTNQAAAMNERQGINTLRKRGPGTLLLSNVQYTLIDGTGDNAANFVWQIGSGVANIGNPFDGVVKESGTSVSNSLRTMRSVILNGGVMGLTSDFSPVLGTNALNNNIFFSMAGSAGGGFAAYGAPRTVTLTPRGSDMLNWGQATSTDNAFFMASTGVLILNAPDADTSIRLSSVSSNYIRIATANSEIRVYDNPATNTDQAVLAIRLQNTGTSVSKTGPGTLILAAVSNDYQAATLVSNGTLIVDSRLTPSASNVTVFSGATLSGTGVISRTVTVQGTGTLTAGATGTNDIGTLTISSNLVLSGSGSLVVDVSGAGADKVVVNGTGTVNVNGLTLVVVPAAGFDMAGGQELTIMTALNGSITGSFTTVPKGYTVRIDGGKTLVLHRDSPGFIFRIQ